MLDWLVRLHFGRWRNSHILKAVWVVLGLIPAAMLVTGTVMWWYRVVRKHRSTAAAPQRVVGFAAEAQPVE